MATVQCLVESPLRKKVIPRENGLLHKSSVVDKMTVFIFIILLQFIAPLRNEVDSLERCLQDWREKVREMQKA